MNRGSFLRRSAAGIAALFAPSLLQGPAGAAVSPQELAPGADELTAARPLGSALVASGGLCAPVTPYYQVVAVEPWTELWKCNPVRGSLPAFRADRGGIRFSHPAEPTPLMFPEDWIE